MTTTFDCKGRLVKLRLKLITVVEIKLGNCNCILGTSPRSFKDHSHTVPWQYNQLALEVYDSNTVLNILAY